MKTISELNNILEGFNRTLDEGESSVNSEGRRTHPIRAARRKKKKRMKTG